MGLGMCRGCAGFSILSLRGSKTQQGEKEREEMKKSRHHLGFASPAGHRVLGWACGGARGAPGAVPGPGLSQLG